LPNITKRTNKDGSVSYLIRVYVDETSTGRQITKSMTWRPAPGMRPSAIEKEVQKQATLFEDKVKSGLIASNGNTKFCEYAEKWLECAEISDKTRLQYEYILKRVNAAIGHLPLHKIRPEHLRRFYANLRDPHVIEHSKSAVSSILDEKRKELSLSYEKISALSGVSADTVSTACKGKAIRLSSAQKISKALGMEAEDLFTISQKYEKLSERTIRLHHVVIGIVLGMAEKDGLVVRNVAKLVSSPKAVAHEVRYLNDEQARSFLSCLQNEPDIRIKSAFTILLFTGCRRGELCGLSWQDIDEDNRMIHIRRQSQYIEGKGVTSTSTKTALSVRNIPVSPIVFHLLREYRSWWTSQRVLYGMDWKGKEQRLFIQEDGNPIFPSTIDYWLRRFCEKNKLPSIHVHGLRHTFISLQVAAGTDVRTLQSMSGHAQASTLLNVYSHSFESAQEKAAAALESMLLPSKAKHG
jgi:integrase